MTIPGGWTDESIDIAGRMFDIKRPADPDAFLEDPETLAEHERSDYMPYWPYLWPAAKTMAALVLTSPLPVPQETLEIGCGIGLIGLAALARGDRVTFSDYRREAVDLALENAAGNGFDAAGGMQLDYHEPADRQFDWIIGSDVIYERALHAPVIDLMQTMLSPKGCCWLGDAGRHQAEQFTHDARTAGLQVRLYNADFNPVDRHAAGEFRLIELRR